MVINHLLNGMILQVLLDSDENTSLSVFKFPLQVSKRMFILTPSTYLWNLSKFSL